VDRRQRRTQTGESSAVWSQWLTRDGQSQQARCPRPWPRCQYFGISLGLGVEANIWALTPSSKLNGQLLNITTLASAYTPKPWRLLASRPTFNWPHLNSRPILWLAEADCWGRGECHKAIIVWSDCLQWAWSVNMAPSAQLAQLTCRLFISFAVTTFYRI